MAGAGGGQLIRDADRAGPYILATGATWSPQRSNAGVGVAVECLIVVETPSLRGDAEGPFPLLPPGPGIAVSHGPFELVA